MSAGVTLAQGPGVPTEFIVKVGTHAKLTLPMASAASPGTLLKYNPGGTPPGLDTAGGSTAVLAGILQETTVDRSALAPELAAVVWGVGILNVRDIKEPVTCWDDGEFQVTNVSGVVAEGDFLWDAASGVFIGTTTTNHITNGSIVCLVGNGGVAAAPITVAVRLT